MVITAVDDAYLMLDLSIRKERFNPCSVRLEERNVNPIEFKFTPHICLVVYYIGIVGP